MKYIHITSIINSLVFISQVSQSAEGVVVGSAIIANIDANLDKSPNDRAQALKTFITSLSSGMMILSFLFYLGSHVLTIVALHNTYNNSSIFSQYLLFDRYCKA